MDWHATWYILPLAFMLDLMLGDPRNFPHPIRWMGTVIEIAEPHFRKIGLSLTASGVAFAACLIVGTWLLTSLLLVAVNHIHPVMKTVFEITLIYFSISAGSLEEAAMEIKHYLQNQEISKARKKVALVVGRDVQSYQQADIARATV